MEDAMLKEAIEKIQATAAPTITRLESHPELNFTDKPVTLIVPPAQDTVQTIKAWLHVEQLGLPVVA